MLKSTSVEGNENAIQTKKGKYETLEIGACHWQNMLLSFLLH
jgi:hypothetical protein